MQYQALLVQIKITMNKIIKANSFLKKKDNIKRNRMNFQILKRNIHSLQLNSLNYARKMVNNNCYLMNGRNNNRKMSHKNI